MNIGCSSSRCANGPRARFSRASRTSTASTGSTRRRSRRWRRSACSAVCIPAEYGGAGMDYLSLGLASEELEYVDTSLRVILSVHVGLNSLSLLTWGTEDQKRRYLVPQAHGRKIATFGLTEPAAGSDARGIQSVAIRKGDRYVLSGEKMWISLADVADHFLVIAWSDLEKKKQRDTSGLTAFLVERGFKGFSSGTIKEKWGILAGNTGYFKMDEVEVPEENVLGRPGEGFKIAMFALDQGRYTVAAGATGLIRGVDADAEWTPTISRSSSCASSNRRPSPARTRWGRATGRIPTTWPSRRCAASWTACRSTARS